MYTYMSHVLPEKQTNKQTDTHAQYFEICFGGILFRSLVVFLFLFLTRNFSSLPDSLSSLYRLASNTLRCRAK